MSVAVDREAEPVQVGRLGIVEAGNFYRGDRRAAFCQGAKSFGGAAFHGREGGDHMQQPLRHSL